MRPRAIADLAIVELPDAEIVVSQGDGTSAVILNSTGAAVLELCDGEHSAAEIGEFICAHVDGVDRDRVADDVHALVTQLAAAGLVEDLDECGSDPSAR